MTLLSDESNTCVYRKRQKPESILYIDRGTAHTLNVYLR